MTDFPLPDGHGSVNILMGRGRDITLLPRVEWEQRLAEVPSGQAAQLRFMSAEHHQVRYFVVQELPRFGAPIPPDVIAHTLQLPLARVCAILEELEQNLFFWFVIARGRCRGHFR